MMSARAGDLFLQGVEPEWVRILRQQSPGAQLCAPSCRASRARVRPVFLTLSALQVCLSQNPATCQAERVLPPPAQPPCAQISANLHGTGPGLARFVIIAGRIVDQCLAPCGLDEVTGSVLHEPKVLGSV